MKGHKGDDQLYGLAALESAHQALALRQAQGYLQHSCTQISCMSGGLCRHTCLTGMRSYRACPGLSAVSTYSQQHGTACWSGSFVRARTQSRTHLISTHQGLQQAPLDALPAVREGLTAQKIRYKFKGSPGPATGSSGGSDGCAGGVDSSACPLTCRAACV